jgi:hypothetical protein
MVGSAIARVQQGAKYHADHTVYAETQGQHQDAENLADVLHSGHHGG